ncbi:ABL020Wp [Eremothecium gossypii ATCC 10895]|uniref:ABL020Wp n=1 Tax=Eremothecium gossypii (strain ATCC 10895 / CBS 109.51 / FGSC 9923 / NRRL Y-1056) TaxID=284811 RepID=Q75DN7_EREGS|nr:ABL020Wp [Eremothecium gossypii ATCC 10895]AAS50751.1 ABL020Wp [Eremothecium gossypii ATCC 10895]AEY95040.1 FABL020Wp [Eremothecium gossypii FDAG1]
MRELNHRSVLSNRASFIISQTVYDRRALDNVADLPLINSLNHLTFLTSSSAKVRETMSEDGALERLVSILHDCYLTLHDLCIGLHVGFRMGTVDSIVRQRKMAMVAWKWTLAFQCLVLTGTRGTQEIRKQVAHSGVIPIIATVLDNYMIYHKNFDFFRDEPIEFDFKSIASGNIFQLQPEEMESFFQKMDKSHPNLRLCINMERFKILVGEDIPSLLDDPAKVNMHNCVPPITRLDTDFQSLWEGTLGLKSDEHPLSDVVLSIPREFFLGRVIPKLDDITWSVQLLAFLTKCTATKPYLQKVSLVESISFRPILERAKERYTLLSNSLPPLNFTDLSLVDDDDQRTSSSKPKVPIVIDPFLMEINAICEESNNKKQAKKSVNFSMLGLTDFTKLKKADTTDVWRAFRMYDEVQMKKRFSYKWDYDKVSRELDEETWNKIINRETLNLFALVERYTVKIENDANITYWSSVVMRNSCRKHEATGVRQCANFFCGKWEDHPKQFPKCRRCKRTKYCSCECQLQSWAYHRYWCHDVGSVFTGTSSTANTTGTHTPNAVGQSAGTTTTTTTAATEVDQSILMTARGNVVDPQGIANQSAGEFVDTSENPPIGGA